MVKLTKTDKYNIVIEYIHGATALRLSERYECSLNWVYAIVNDYDHNDKLNPELLDKLRRRRKYKTKYEGFNRTFTKPRKHDPEDHKTSRIRQTSLENIAKHKAIKRGGYEIPISKERLYITYLMSGMSIKEAAEKVLRGHKLNKTKKDS